jgi:hypothetical protein
VSPWFHRTWAAVAHSYGGNFAASFAVYFLAAIATLRRGLGRLAAAASAALVVEAFEVTNGFGVMANVYDPSDLVANLVGIGAALALDFSLRRDAATSTPASGPDALH